MKRNCHEIAPIVGRIKKITGQMQGVGRMLENNRECPDILHTISSIHSALRSLEALLVEDHVRHCVSDAASDPDQLERRLTEIITLYKRRLS
jgi:DNA-binding FrmR family transcriptional regulator